MMFGGLKVWVDCAWVVDDSPEPEKRQEGSALPASERWIRRQRPVLGVLGIMLTTHVLGILVFWLVTRGWLIRNSVMLPFLLHTKQYTDMINLTGHNANTLRRAFCASFTKLTDASTSRHTQNMFPVKTSQSVEPLLCVDRYIHYDSVEFLSSSQYGCTPGSPSVYILIVAESAYPGSQICCLWHIGVRMDNSRPRGTTEVDMGLGGAGCVVCAVCLYNVHSTSPSGRAGMPTAVVEINTFSRRMVAISLCRCCSPRTRQSNSQSV